MANGGGGRGKEQVRAFYADVLIPQWPDDAQMQPVNRVLGEGQLADELHLVFTHAKQMNWLLPNVPATNRKVEMDVVIVVLFRHGLIAVERIYWDHAAVLRQVGSGSERTPPELELRFSATTARQASKCLT